MPRRFISAACLALVVPLVTVAQEELPLEIAKRRAAFQKEIALVVGPIDESYRKALVRLEREFALEKDYEAAIAARDERKALEHRMQSVGSASSEANGNAGAGTEPSTIPSTTTTTVEKGGPLTFAASSSKDGALIEGESLRLGKADLAAEWPLGEIEPGAYDVVIHYAATADSSVKVQEYFFRLSGDLPATGGETEFSEHTLGILKVTSRATTIRLTAGGPLLLKEIRLVPR